MRPSNNRGFRYTRMIDECALDLHRADSMSRHVEHIVDPAEQPEEAVAVTLGTVAGEIHIGRPAVPVLLDVPIRIAIDAAQHRWPWARQREQTAAGTLNVLALVGLD